MGYKMRTEILHKSAFAELKVYLSPGESVTAEAGAMVYMSPNIGVRTTTGGGLLKGLARKILTKQTLFMNTYYAERGEGYITFAPGLPGDIMEIDISKPLYVSDTNYLASTGVQFGVKFTGFKGIFTPGGMFWFKLEGVGKVWLGTFGGIDVVTLNPGEKLLVDNIHLAAFDADTQFTLRKFGRMKSFLFGGEYILTEFVGPGRVFIQSRNLPVFANILYRYMPKNND